MLQSPQTVDLPNPAPAGAAMRREARHPALERLICAAISNAQLSKLLLASPVQALRQYEVGRSLSDHERRLVLSVTGARNIHEFAGHLHALVVQAQHEHARSDHRPFERTTAEPSRPALAAASHS